MANYIFITTFGKYSRFTHSNTRLISFDVCSLFTKVPINDVLAFLTDEIKNYDLPLEPEKIIELIKLCVNNCKFTFNGEFYQQTFGMAMGNPLSPLLANLYMEFFERKYLPKITGMKLVWFRYVDDIICIIQANFDVNLFLQKLNEQVTSIKFTVEMENNKSLPFLDVLIIREEFKLNYNIYRKPTNDLAYVHHYSGHSIKIKRSIFSSMYLRALRIVSPEYLDDEFNKIREIGIKLCYPNEFLDKCLNSAKKTFYNASDNVVTSRKNILCLPYLPAFESLSSMLKVFDVKCVFTYEKTIRKIMIKNSPISNCNVVYKIPCSNCNAFYIGQTGKDIETRLEQHRYSVRSGQISNALFIHVQEFSHRINWASSSTITRCNRFNERNVIETALIHLTKENNLNISYGRFAMDPIILYMLGKELRETIKSLVGSH